MTFEYSNLNDRSPGWLLRLHFTPGARAPDHFHPDDTGYAAIAADFTTAILARQLPGLRP